ncbi:prolipoprotein diacylglyceryl transferase [Sphingomonadaceae bacterium G21617-S1]|uniref:prolipoprotein diacylglyceryl transferase n=1 Tax=Rhizorhabdus sp. TaxID=1968843 RepID=UPI0012163F6D|nr:prolipoprotein diacylglyceryl transferase [Rhizorhabdus sp.]MBD3759886.1 prolipoprotein diacylglyceryl transferase [Rhizorhabdus sp.]MCZ4342658.1 prolipoprotein diacylglyceryl transferase [Sphingomonadaceae bacterium G21617-S1]TAK14027.1 MAG: prolipoprotein diacylglyceryl transferase [Rhizorhabdus sp.]
MQLPVFAAAAQALHFDDLKLNPIALDLGVLQVHWYSLAYIAGILLGWYYLIRLIAQPNAPLARRHADDLVFYATLGILLGGRLAYVFFYQPEIMAHPLDILKLWQGGMSFHGGAIGVSIAILYLTRSNGLSWLRVHDYVACCVPFGLFFGRIANFVNGELWGRPTDVPWAIIFPDAPDGLPRHPSQLYEAGLEGIVLGLVLAFFFWRTNARNQPGKLVGIFLLGYGLSRFVIEFFREPDVQLGTLSWGLTMGQTLTVPMLIGGAYLVATASRRSSIDAS